LTASTLKTHFSVYLLSNALSMGAVLLSSLYLVFSLTKAEYGALSSYLVVLSFVSMFVGLSVHGAVGASFFRLDSRAFAEYVSSAILVLLATLVAVGLFFLIFRHYVRPVTQISDKWVALACLEAFFRFSRLILLSIFVSMTDARRYSIYQLGYSLLDLLLILVFVSLYSNAESRLYAQLAASGCFIALTVVNLHKLQLLTVMVRGDHLRDILKYGVFLFPAVLGSFFMTMTDKYFINVLVGREALATYMFCFQLSAGAAVLWESFNRVYAPRLYAVLAGGEGGRELTRVKQIYIGSVLLVTIGGAVAAYYLVPYIVPPEYDEARAIMPVLILGEGLNGLYLIYNNYFHYFNKTYILSMVTLASGLVGVVLLSNFLVQFGVLFAAFTYLIVCLVRVLSVRVLLRFAH